MVVVVVATAVSMEAAVTKTTVTAADIMVVNMVDIMSIPKVAILLAAAALLRGAVAAAITMGMTKAKIHRQNGNAVALGTGIEIASNIGGRGKEET